MTPATCTESLFVPETLFGVIFIALFFNHGDGDVEVRLAKSRYLHVYSVRCTANFFFYSEFRISQFGVFQKK